MSWPVAASLMCTVLVAGVVISVGLVAGLAAKSKDNSGASED